tara:strand:- start:739 stop:1632 length:894 start_codon:yes stop_codon:yes gene_type:complete
MSKNGEQIGGVVGFFNNTLKIVERSNPEAVYVIWEAGGSKRKRQLYSEYKTGSRPASLNRYYDDIPDTLQNRNYQIKTLIDLLSKFPVTQIYVEDAEADDAIGYLSKYKLKQKNKIIVSSDHDFYQLIDKDLVIWSPTLKSFVGTEKVIQRFGIHPNNFCLAKSISGDSSDNIPGVKGVSYKTLSKYFPRFLNEDDYLIDEFFDDVKELKKIKKLKILDRLSCSTQEALVRRNWKLVHLDLNNLSGSQIKKIDEKIENPNNLINNMGAHKILQENGIVSIDLIKAKILFKNIKPRKI